MSTKTEAQRAANARWQVRRRRLVSYGQWEPFVDAEPVREHLRQINAAGMPYMVISERLGLAQNSSLQHLMWGRGNYGPGRQVRRETAELVLAYWPSLNDFPDAARIDATGTRRRIEALAVRGWPRRVMAERVGMRREHFQKVASRERVTARLARKVAEMYDAWWNEDPLEHGISLHAASRVQADAQRAGLHSALAWDDDTIDDPQAVPRIDAPKPVASEGENLVDRWLLGEAVVLGPMDRKKALVHLFEWSELSPAQIAERLETTEAAAEQAWFRHVRACKAEGRPVPWRRRWALRNKELSKNEMGAAA